MKKHLLAVAAAALASCATAAHANTVDGSVYFVTDAVARAATPANVPAGPAALTFTVGTPFTFTNDTPFGTNNSSVDTVQSFLSSGGALCLTGCGNASQPLDNTLWNFTGFVTVTNGQHFLVTHDDGLTLVINGITVIDESGPTSPVTDDHVYSGANGTFAFQLVYGECCGGPAELQIGLPLSREVGSVPEPSTWAMMILGFAGVGFMAYRRRQNGPALRMV